MATITFTCYACNQVLKVGGDKAGKKARCVKCGTILTIPAEGGDADADVVEPLEDDGPPRRGRARDDDDEPRRRARDDDDDDDDRSRRRPRDDDEDDRSRRRPRDDFDDEDNRPRRRGRDEDDEDRPRRRSRGDGDDYDDGPRGKWGSWPKVGLGMMLNAISFGVLIGFGGLMVLALLFRLIALPATSEGMLKTAGVFGMIAVFIYVFVQIPNVVGYVFCLFTPNKKGGMALAITNLAIAATSLILKIIFVLIPLFKLMDGGMVFLGAGAPLLGFPIIQSQTKAIVIIFGILILLIMDSEWIMAPIYVRSVGLAVKDRYLVGGAMVPLFIGAAAAALRLTLFLLFLLWAGAMAEAGPGGGDGKAMFYVTSILGMLTYGAVAVYGLFQMRSYFAARGALP